MSSSDSKKITINLMISQAFYLSAMSIDLTITALVGAFLSGNKAFATIPIALISILSVIVAPQIPQLANSIGLKRLLQLGGIIAAGGGLFSWYSLNAHSFIFLCIGTSCVGVYQAIANYYRYVAADVSKGNEVSSISLIMSAGIFAAIVGPMLATWASNLLTPFYSGAYLVVAILGLLSAVSNSFLPKTSIDQTMQRPDENPAQKQVKINLQALLKRPAFRNGIILLLCSCFSMSLVMAGAPIIMQAVLHNTPSQRMLGMQLHMIGMYLPTFLLLFVAKYLKIRLQISFALLIGLGAAISSMFSLNAVTISLTLLLIGIFWSLSYATGSALLTKSYQPAERKSARGKGELFPVLGMAIGSLFAGPFSKWIPWSAQMALILVLIFVSVSFIAYDWKKI